jgi:hypothetical protein
VNVLPLATARDRAAVVALGEGTAFTNQVLFIGGHTTASPYADSPSIDVYFGK